MRLRISKLFPTIMLAALVLAVLAGCGLWKSRSGTPENVENESEISTNIPFSTREPETFQAEIIISSFVNEQKSVQRYFIARRKENSLQTFYQGNKKTRSFLRTDENKIYLINHQTKNYRQLNADKLASFSDDKLIKSLTSKWLNEKNPASFEKLGTEKGLTRYRVKFDNSSKTDVFIYIDEKLNLPVRQEFFSLRKDQKVLTFQMEIKNFKTEAGEEMFQLPENYRQLSVNNEQ